MNLIRCSCGSYTYYTENDCKEDFKLQHKPHLAGKFKVYPSELLQIASNLRDDNEEPEPVIHD